MNSSVFTDLLLRMAFYPFSYPGGFVFSFCAGCCFFCGCFAIVRRLFKCL